ncbi:MAG: GNAT family N-acetyltransferase [Anaerolineae bacterium]
MILHETESFNLRSFTQADADAFLGWRNDPLVARYQGWQVPYPRESAERFMTALETAVPGQPGEWYQVAIEHKQLGVLIGDCAFKTAEDGIQAEVGYTLARQFHGKGYATEAVKGLFDYLFNTLNMHRISAFCDTRNEPSWKLLQRLGLRLEGHYIENYRDGGSWGSEYQYAILKREWGE